MRITATLVPSSEPVSVSLRMSGHGVFLKMRNRGWKMTCWGIRLPAVNSTRKNTLNFHEYREQA